ncbi:hypothetical protein PO124_31930 [Bacillus licheniformis]|nr:hypothetical protein [Bacillus licheniformis]
MYGPRQDAKERAALYRFLRFADQRQGSGNFGDGEQSRDLFMSVM